VTPETYITKREHFEKNLGSKNNGLIPRTSTPNIMITVTIGHNRE